MSMFLFSDKNNCFQSIRAQCYMSVSYFINSINKNIVGTFHDELFALVK